MDGTRTTGMAFKINLVIPGNGDKFVVELNNETLTNIECYQADDGDLTITINRADLEQVMMVLTRELYNIFYSSVIDRIPDQKAI